MHYQESLKRVSDLATQQYISKTDDRLFFHNLAHTIRVLEAVRKMIAHYVLDDKNSFIVSAAAWLYDLNIIDSKTGSFEVQKTDHYDGVLKSANIDEEHILEIQNCLSAALSIRQPVSLNEKILCDACSFDLGSSYFTFYNKFLQRETEAFSQEKIKGTDWRSRTISKLQQHTYFTDYCQSLLDKPKAFNLQNMLRVQEEKLWQLSLHNGNRQKKSKKTRENAPVHNMEGSPGNTASVDKSNKYPAWKYKSKHHLSGVETVFRNSSSNHLNLSVMADNKAFIMISVNSILISVGIGLIIGKFVLIPKLFIPTVLLLTVNVATIIYSVLATRPGVMRGTFTREGVDNKTVDLLFFGNFFKMPLIDFEYGMRKMMDDDDFLYGNLIRDIYSQGKTLGRKFRLLRISYNLFMYGTALTVLAYVISFFL
jgi:predicted metal-dependent HD superfamily phosphohydrolase